MLSERAALQANESFKDHPYIAFVDKQTPWLRELYAKDAPRGQEALRGISAPSA